MNETQKQLIKEIEGLLEDKSTFGSGVNILTYGVLNNGDVSGRFQDGNRRVFTFTVSKKGVSYRPALNLDSLDIEDAIARLDSYSEGYTRFDKASKNKGQKRLEKPKCSSTSYACGFACIDIRKNCELSENENVPLERVYKIRQLARDVKQGKIEGYTQETYNELRNKTESLSAEYENQVKKVKGKLARQVYFRLKPLNRAEDIANVEKTLSEELAFQEGKKGESLTEQEKLNIIKKTLETAKSSGKQLSAKQTREYLKAYHESVKDSLDDAIKQKELKITKAYKKRESKEITLKEMNAEIKKIQEEESKHIEKIMQTAREFLYVKNPSKFKSNIKGVRDMDTMDITETKVKPEQEKAINKGLEFFRNIVEDRSLNRSTIDINIMTASTPEGKKEASRAYYSIGNLYIEKKVDPATVAHELGHWLEANNSEIKEKTANFLNQRTKKERWQKLSKITGNSFYGDDEVAKKDKFLSPYMGKRYEFKGQEYQPGSSEILSMGIEYMYRDPMGLAQKDPEYFDFIYDILKDSRPY